MKTLEESLRLVRTGTLPDSGFSYLDAGFSESPYTFCEQALEKGVEVGKLVSDNGQLSIFADNREMTLRQMTDAAGAVPAQMAVYKALNMPLLLPENIENLKILAPAGKFDGGDDLDYYYKAVLYIATPIAATTPVDVTNLDGCAYRKWLEESHPRPDQKNPFCICSLNEFLSGKQAGDFTLKGYRVEGTVESSKLCKSEVGKWYTYTTLYEIDRKDYGMKLSLAWDSKFPEMLKGVDMSYTVYDDSNNKLASLAMNIGYSESCGLYNKRLEVKKQMPGFEDCPAASLEFNKEGMLYDGTRSYARIEEALYRSRNRSAFPHHNSLTESESFGYNYAGAIVPALQEGKTSLDYAQTIENLSNIATYSKQELLEFALLAFDKR